jgi:hypothetical protein
MQKSSSKPPPYGRTRTVLHVAALSAVLMCWTGCTQLYVIKFSGGSQIVASSKPKLKDGTFYFKDAAGKQTSVPAGRVSEIAPASMVAKEKDKDVFKPSVK